MVRVNIFSVTQFPPACSTSTLELRLAFLALIPISPVTFALCLKLRVSDNPIPQISLISLGSFPDNLYSNVKILYCDRVTFKQW